MTIIDPYKERREANQRSASWARKRYQPWSEDDDAFLLAEWIDVPGPKRDEVLISQLLERTIESCRNRCEIIRKRLGIQVCNRADEPPEDEPKPYIGAEDDPEEAWWTPGYYTHNKEVWL